jgi:hypothetical protein
MRSCCPNSRQGFDALIRRHTITECRMSYPSLSIAYPVSRTRTQRVVDRLRAAWQRIATRRKQQRERDSALHTLAHLDARTLKDIGMPEEFRAQVLLLHEARNTRWTASMR